MGSVWGVASVLWGSEGRKIFAALSRDDSSSWWVRVGFGTEFTWMTFGDDSFVVVAIVPSFAIIGVCCYRTLVRVWCLVLVLVLVLVWGLDFVKRNGLSRHGRP